MSGIESHPVRNGIIATVVGGIILSVMPSGRGALKWVWGRIASASVWVWQLLTSTYNTPGWLVLIGVLLLALSAWKFLSSLDISAPTRAYTSDVIYGLKWRWRWLGNSIHDLWCYCPQCDAQLVYDDSSCRSFSRASVTDFICEHCSRRVVGTIPGGGKSYALEAVEREIHRRIRVGDVEL